MKLIYYPKCSTCQKAKKFLDDHNLKYESQDIKLNPPTEKELTSYIEKSKLPIKKFINTSGLIYKNLNLKDKLDKMTNKEIIKLLSENGMLIKRPILINGNTILVGFKEDEYINRIK